jgi:hypothetical protein
MLSARIPGRNIGVVRSEQNTVSGCMHDAMSLSVRCRLSQRARLHGQLQYRFFRQLLSANEAFVGMDGLHG